MCYLLGAMSRVKLPFSYLAILDFTQMLLDWLQPTYNVLIGCELIHTMLLLVH